MKLTYNDIVNLGNWHFIQFRDQRTAEEAMRKYELHQARTGDSGASAHKPPPPPAGDN